MNDTIDMQTGGKPSPFDAEKLSEITRKLASRMPKPRQERIFDLYGKDELMPHLRRFMEHCVAKGINPDIPTIIDWLYSEKAFNERDDFVKIERLMEMVQNGMVFPMLIIEVLDYAKRVEDAAISVVEESKSVEHGLKSMDALEDVLNTRLEIYREENAAISMKGIMENALGGLSKNASKTKKN